MSDHNPGVSDIRWPTGIATLCGLLIGAFVGIATHLIPVGMVMGLACGAGIDSILNHLLNAIPRNPSEQ